MTFDTRPLRAIECDAAVLLVFQDKAEGPAADTLAELAAAREFTGKSQELALIHHPAGFAARRLLLVGLGKEEKFTQRLLREATGAAIRHLKSKGVKTVAVHAQASEEPVAAIAEGAILGHWEPDAYKTDRSDVKEIDQVSLVGDGMEALAGAIERGRILAESQNVTRALVNEPSNRLTPMLLAERARAVAAETSLECEVIDQDRMRQLGMGAVLGVAQGSAEPPCLIVLRYRPEQAASDAHLGLVGKGVTFDSGGLSIKTADGMEKMKYDMAGGAAVIGAMRAIAQLKPRVAVTALIPAVENMIGSRAQRPGDIVTSLSGKTIEVLNTDAEGRLILADALTYAKRLGCTHLIDVATLTGSVVVALGHLRVGLFSNDEAMQARVLGASEAEGERMWAMPMDDDYKDYLKSAFADLPNIGGRWGGSITAAMFLREFAESTPWVHLDVAGTAWIDDSKPHTAKGPSGVPVRTLVRVATDFA
ncbi:MAG: leucyl aminopeptidase [Bryobacteraceae bacterium]